MSTRQDARRSEKEWPNAVCGKNYEIDQVKLFSMCVVCLLTSINIWHLVGFECGVLQCVLKSCCDLTLYS